MQSFSSANQRMIEHDSTLETLASYLPTLIVRRLAANPEPITAPTADHFPAAVLAADLSGFTLLTEYLAQDGAAGVETLSDVINDYFGQLIDLLLAHGGDVVEFTGDGFIALWPVDTIAARGADATDAMMAMAVHRATQFGLVAQQEFGSYIIDRGLRMSLRITISAGMVMVATVGGVRERWELLVTGDSVVRVLQAEQQTKAREVVLTAEAWRLVADCFDGEMRESGVVAVSGIRRRLLPQELPGVTLRPAMDHGMRAYLPGAIFAHLDAGQTQWLAELRLVTVVFLKVIGIDYHAPRILYRLHVIMRALQKSLYQYEGSLNQFVVDDKGTVLVAAFGLPPLTHEDDAERGVRAALMMQTRLGQLGLRCSIGITSGRVFTGSRGSRRRRDYAMIGSVINVAARLMQAAHDDIFCDHATYESCQASASIATTSQRVVFEALPPIVVKGKATPIPIYRPRIQRAPAIPLQMVVTVGRHAERAIISRHLHDLLHATLHAAGEHRQHTHMLIIEGDAGMGKSQVVYDAMCEAHRLHILTLLGPSNAIDRETPYHAWRPIIYHLFDLDSLPDSLITRRMHVMARLEANPEIAHLAPLINEILHLDIQDTLTTVQMTGQLRAENTQRLLIHILQMTAEQTPMMLVLDNIHWMDSASLALLVAVSHRVTPLLLVLTTRPYPEPVPLMIQQLFRHPCAHHLRLQPLTRAESALLISHRLNVASVSSSIVDQIVAKAEGNPLFTEELSYALRDSGRLRIEEGTCTIAGHGSTLDDLALPDSIQGVIMSRIDQLTAPQQLTLKVASVVGATFTLTMLMSIYPIERERPHVPDHIQVLDRLDIITLQTREPTSIYSFKHIIIQETIYQMLLFAQRRELHAAIARWYEQTYADDLTPFYALLAHHWRNAGVIARALDYLTRASEHALRNYANQEAMYIVREAITLISNDDSPAASRAIVARTRPRSLRSVRSPAEIARLHVVFGEAAMNLGQLTESRNALTHALLLLRQPIPTTHISTWVILGMQIMRQGVHRIGLSGMTRRRHRPETLLLSARAYHLLMALHYFANETMPALTTSLYALNLLESADTNDSSHTRSKRAEAYANLSMVSGSLAIHPLATLYGHLARTTAHQSHHAATLAYVLNLTSLYDIGMGRWGRVRYALEQAILIADQIGDHRLWGETWTLLAQVDYYQGHFLRAASMCEYLAERTSETQNMLQHAWALGGRGQNALRLGLFDDAVLFLTEAIDQLAESGEKPSLISNYGLLAVAHLRNDADADALRAAEAANALIETIAHPSAYYLIEGYSGVAEVFLAFWERALLGGETLGERGALLRRWQQESHRACRRFYHYAAIFPIGKPRAWLWYGCDAWLRGNDRVARHAWRTAMNAAHQLNMPYEQGLIWYEVGRRSRGEERARYLDQAGKMFQMVAAAADLERTEQARQQLLDISYRQSWLFTWRGAWFRR